MTAVAEEAPASSQMSRRQMNLVFGTVMLGMLLAALDQTIVSTALPTIVADVGGAQHLSWVVSSYLLAETVATVLAGKFGDLFGRKLMLQLSAAMFIAASAACGLAEDMLWLIAWRAVQGIGAGGLIVTATALIADVIPLRQRGAYQGAIGAVFGVSTVLGPLLGGLFTDHLSWRWAFYVNLPIGIVMIAVAAFTLPRIGKRTRPPVDYLGITFVAIGASTLTLAVSWGGSEYAWGSALIIGLFVVAAVCLALFIWAESRAADPILPLRLFRGQVFAISVVLSFIVGFAMLGAMTYLPTYMQYVLGISATGSGLHTLPMVVGLLLTSTVAGTLVGRTGRYKIFPVVGAFVTAVGLFLLSRMDPDTQTLEMSVYLIVLGLGLGLCMQTLTLIVQNTSDYADLGVATSGVTFFRTLGGSFGVSIMGTVYANRLGDRMPAAIQESGVDPSQVDTSAISPAVLDQLSAAQRAPIIEAYADSIQGVFLAAVPVALLAFVLALFLKEVPLRDSTRATANDVGEGFAMAEGDDNEAALHRAVAALIRHQEESRFAALRLSSGSALDASSAWCVRQIEVRSRLGLGTGLADVAAGLLIPPEVLAPAFASAADEGFLRGADDAFALTQRGREELEKITVAVRGWLFDELADWGQEGDDAFRDATITVARHLVDDDTLNAPARSPSGRTVGGGY